MPSFIPVSALIFFVRFLELQSHSVDVLHVHSVFCYIKQSFCITGCSKGCLGWKAEVQLTFGRMQRDPSTLSQRRGEQGDALMPLLFVGQQLVSGSCRCSGRDDELLFRQKHRHIARSNGCSSHFCLNGAATRACADGDLVCCQYFACSSRIIKVCKGWSVMQQMDGVASEQWPFAKMSPTKVEWRWRITCGRARSGVSKLSQSTRISSSAPPSIRKLKTELETETGLLEDSRAR